MIPQPHSTKGRLLLAAPPLEDPNFDRTVVYMVDHSPEGAIGLVLNRPLPNPEVGEVDGLDSWARYISDPPVLFAGGPVELNALVGLAVVAGQPGEWWAEVSNGVCTVDLGADAAALDARVTSLRIFSGYSGWGPHQLDGELEEGAWIVLDAEHGDLFGPNSDDLWRAVLRRQGGRLAWIANAPDDLSMN